MRKDKNEQQHEKHERAVRWSLGAVGALLAAVFLAPLIAGGGIIAGLPLDFLFVRIPGSFQPAGAILIRFLIFASAGLLATYFYLSREAFFINTSVTVPVLLYLGIAALSMIWSVSHYATLIALLELFGEVLFLFLVIHLMVTRPRVYWLIGALAGAVAISCMLGIQEYLVRAVSEWRSLSSTGGAGKGFGGFVSFMLTSPPDWRIYGTFFNPNIFANFLIVAIPILLSRYLLSDERASVVGFGFLVVLAFVALMLTASKGAWGALLVAMALYGVLAGLARAPMGPRPLVRLVSIAIALLFLGVVFVQPMLNRLGAATTTEAHSGAFRAYLWKSTVRIIEAHPFGTGLGTFELAYPRYALVGHTQMAHNDYLQMASEVGIPGLIVFLAILVMIARTVLLSLAESRRGAPPRHSAVPLLMVGFAAAVCASALHSLVDYAWYVPATGLALWMAIGMTEVTSGISDPKPVRFGALAWIGSLAILLILFAVNGRILSSAWDADTAQTLEMQGLYREALQYRESALQSDPWNPENHNRLARLLPAAGEQDRAIDETRRAIAMEPSNAGYQVSLAALLTMSKDYAGARRAYHRATALDPNADDVWQRLAQFETLHGKHEDALAAWRRVVEIENSPVGRWPAIPELVDVVPARAHVALAREAASKHHWQEASDHYRRADQIIARFQAAQQSYQYQAMREIGQSDPQEAKELVSLRVNLLEELSEAYQAAGRPADARKAREQAEKLKNQAD